MIGKVLNHTETSQFFSIEQTKVAEEASLPVWKMHLIK